MDIPSQVIVAAAKNKQRDLKGPYKLGEKKIKLIMFLSLSGKLFQVPLSGHDRYMLRRQAEKINTNVFCLALCTSTLEFLMPC
ncbi:hypothetical protein RRG08_004159 [Elysia crispata]|uniref:Uncharacterized protein n=1 Tax=Elysia crispata TaxID=231223 RepID=A0AAE1D6L6_9GAST|nr:hypothetical protein RRG08_004159 [Elysia crispata]